MPAPATILTDCDIAERSFLARPSDASADRFHFQANGDATTSR